MTSESTKLRPWSGDRAPASWGLGDGQAIPWEYAPAPESRDIVRLKERYGLFIDGREAITLPEVLATSDVPGGVVNVITGPKGELVPVLAGHVDVDTIDIWGVDEDARRDTELLATDNVKRIVRRPAGITDARFDWLDDRAAERPEWIAAYLEMKTVWHPIGV